MRSLLILFLFSSLFFRLPLFKIRQGPRVSINFNLYKKFFNLKELPPLPQEHQQTNNLNENNSLSTRQQFNNNNNLSSPSPRPSSSRGGKRSASAVDDDDDFTMIPSSSNDEGKNLNSATDLHNPVKRRSSNGKRTGIF